MNSNEKQPTPLSPEDIERFSPDPMAAFRANLAAVVKRNAALTELSMGMSGDFEEAIEEGANVVRVGQAIFGKRPTPDGHYWPGFVGVSSRT
jgi:hypothetical protein